MHAKQTIPRLAWKTSSTSMGEGGVNNSSPSPHNVPLGGDGPFRPHFFFPGHATVLARLRSGPRVIEKPLYRRPTTRVRGHHFQHPRSWRENGGSKPGLEYALGSPPKIRREKSGIRWSCSEVSPRRSGFAGGKVLVLFFLGRNADFSLLEALRHDRPRRRGGSPFDLARVVGKSGPRSAAGRVFEMDDVGRRRGTREGPYFSDNTSGTTNDFWKSFHMAGPQCWFLDPTSSCRTKAGAKGIHWVQPKTEIAPGDSDPATFTVFDHEFHTCWRRSARI